MGLDAVELVLATEEEFGISIDDADAANITTPRLLANYVVSRLGNVGVGEYRCLSQAGFYKIRSVLVRQFGASRKDVQLESHIKQFLKGDVKKQWHQLQAAIGATQLPGLQCKRSTEILATIGVPLLVLLLFIWAGLPIGAAFFAVIVAWIASIIGINRIADQIPPALTTIRTLVPYAGIPKADGWSYEYVLQRVIQITSLQVGIPVENIHPDNHFIKDLGID